MFDLSAGGFLAALQLADSFFPSGMYAHSHGLEGMVHLGLVSSVEEVEEFLRNQLAWAALPSDGVALLNAHRASAAGDVDTLAAIDRLLYAMKLPNEMRAASTQLGQRILAETAPFAGHPVHLDYSHRVATKETPGNGAVALAVACFALEVPETPALLSLCHSHAVSVLGAASRLLPLAHSDAQAVLRRLHPLVTNLAREIWERPWQEMTAFTPQLDLVAMTHESDDLRLFAS